MRLAATAIAVAVLLPLCASGAAQATEAGPSFVDPTARGFEHVELGSLVYVAPFAVAETGHDDDDDDGDRRRREHSKITIGDESDVQDSVYLDATRGSIHLGELVILAHDAAVVGPTEIGEEGVCPGGTAVCPSFVGFNAVVDGATIEKDAMVQALARVGPGVTIPSGRKVLPGKYVRTQAEVASETEPVTAADRAFMGGVVEVNSEFAIGYTELEEESRSNVRGINYNPQTTFNDRGLPSFAGAPTRDPRFRNRIIGGVQLADTKEAASKRMDDRIAIRGDEGEPLVVGRIARIEANHTVHALEHAEVLLGDGGRYGFHSVVHGGGPRGPESTRAGDDFRLGDLAVFFRSQAGDNVRIGDRSLVQGAVLASGTRVPRCTVIVGAATYPLEWCNVPFPLPDGGDGDDD